jgi:hypothetical protein
MGSDRRIFGERLKRQRERRGITLAEIAKTTKVAASLFEGLETGDCSRWPAGLYARGYVRAYAEAVGLNPQEIVEEFAATFPAGARTDRPDNLPVEQPARVAGTLRLSLEEPAISPTRVAKRVGLAAADLVIGFLIAAVTHVGLGAGLWPTVSVALAYYAFGRIVSDDPLLYWMYLRVRTAPAPEPQPEPQATDVPVGDAASTTA